MFLACSRDGYRLQSLAASELHRAARSARCWSGSSARALRDRARLGRGSRARRPRQAVLAGVASLKAVYTPRQPAGAARANDSRAVRAIPTRSSISPSPPARPARRRASCTRTTRCSPTPATWCATGTTDRTRVLLSLSPLSHHIAWVGDRAVAGRRLRVRHQRSAARHDAARLDRRNRRHLRDGRADARDGHARRAEGARHRAARHGRRCSTWRARRSRRRWRRGVRRAGHQAAEHLRHDRELLAPVHASRRRRGDQRHHLRPRRPGLRDAPVGSGRPRPRRSPRRGRRDRRARRRADARLLRQPGRDRGELQPRRLVHVAATSACSTSAATCRSSGARRTSSSAAATTSIRRTSRRWPCATRRWRAAPAFRWPTSGSASACASPSSGSSVADELLAHLGREGLSKYDMPEYLRRGSTRFR